MPPARRKLLGDAALYDPVPDDTCMFGSPGFWDERYYVNCEPFEWYHDYAALKPLLEQFMTKEMHILLVGCGSSEMARDMYEDGYTSLFNVDISRVVVDEMAMRYESISKKIKKKKKKKKGEASMKEIPKMYFEDDLGGIQWKQADATDLTAIFNDKIFDVVVDKALLDALYCSEVPGKQTHKYLQEMDRILTPEGLFFCVSFGLPENRLDKIEDTDEESDGFLAWEVEVHAIPKLMPNQYKVSQLKKPEDVYYVYTCRKEEKMDNEKMLKKKAEKARAAGKKIPTRNKR